MKDHHSLNQFKSWCRDQGGLFKEMGEDNRCVFAQNMGMDTAYVEVDDHAEKYHVKDREGNVLDITEETWENWEGTPRESDFENHQQANYTKEDKDRAGDTGGEVTVHKEPGTNKLQILEHAQIHSGGVWNKKVLVEVEKDPEWIAEHTNQLPDLEDEPDEPFEEYDEFECPDETDFIEVYTNEGEEIEGEIKDIECSDTETRVFFEGEDNIEDRYVVYGSPEGQEPIVLKDMSGDEVGVEDVETFGVQRRSFR